MKKFYKRLVTFVGSKRLFYFILAVFVFESAWVALSGVYPMAFDEDYHLGLIKIYSQHLSPFITKQPPNSGAFRSVVHDPSYLYHYLMSFPYRFTNMLSHNQTVDIIVLRLIDVVLMAVALVIFRRLLQKTKASSVCVNLALLFFILTPVVPLLAGQINYDDLFIPLVGLALLLTVKIVENFKDHNSLNVDLLAGLAVLCLLTSLVKYPFLPIFMAIVIYLTVIFIKYRHVLNLKYSNLLRSSWRKISTWRRVLWMVLIAISLVMFLQRYGYNAVTYHAVQPRCDQVLSIKECSQNGPWERDFNLEQSRGHVDANPILFTGSWIYGLFERSFFAVNGPASNYSSKQFLPILGVTAAAVGILGALFFIIYRKQILAETRFLRFLLFAALIYCIALYFDNYVGFLRTGQKVAINGRYLFPVFLPVYLSMALGWQKFLARNLKLKVILPIIVFLIFITQGGGTLTFILRSNPHWYWPNNRVVDSANRYVRDAFNPIVLH